MANTTDLTARNDYQPEINAPTVHDSEVIRRQIDFTRAQLGTTIQAIGDRLSPDNLIEQAKSSAREATVGRIKEMKREANRKVEDVSTGFSQTVRDNPLPVAVIGLGLGWLLLSERNKRDAYRMDEYAYRNDDYRYYSDMRQDSTMHEARERVGQAAATVENKAAEVKHRVGSAVNEATDAVGDAASRAGEMVNETGHRVGEKLSETASRVGDTVSQTANRVGETTERVQERASDAAERARNEAEKLRREAEWRSRRAAYRTKQSFWQNMNENPLAVGAVLAVAGAAVGAAIPTTEYENKLMGETRDRLLDEAKVRAQDVVERVQTVVDDTQRAAVTELKESTRQQNLTVDDMIGDKEDAY